jgi:hypothetical protein
MRQYTILFIFISVFLFSCEEDKYQTDDNKYKKFSINLGLENKTSIEEDEMSGGGTVTGSDILVIQIKNKSTNEIVAAGLFEGKNPDVPVTLKIGDTYNIEATVIKRGENINSSIAPFNATKNPEDWTSNHTSLGDLSKKSSYTGENELLPQERWYYNEDVTISDVDVLDIKMKRMSFKLRHTNSNNHTGESFFIGFGNGTTYPVAKTCTYFSNSYCPSNTTCEKVFTVNNIRSVYNNVKSNPEYSFQLSKILFLSANGTYHSRQIDTKYYKLNNVYESGYSSPALKTYKIYIWEINGRSCNIHTGNYVNLRDYADGTGYFRIYIKTYCNEESRVDWCPNFENQSWSYNYYNWLDMNQCGETSAYSATYSTSIRGIGLKIRDTYHPEQSSGYFVKWSGVYYSCPTKKAEFLFYYQ